MQNIAEGYRVVCYSSVNCDDEIKQAANAPSLGSGFGPDGRDNDFLADSADKASQIKDRLLDLNAVHLVEIFDPSGNVSRFKK